METGQTVHRKDIGLTYKIAIHILQKIFHKLRLHLGVGARRADFGALKFKKMYNIIVDVLDTHKDEPFGIELDTLLGLRTTKGRLATQFLDRYFPLSQTSTDNESSRLAYFQEGAPAEFPTFLTRLTERRAAGNSPIRVQFRGSPDKTGHYRQFATIALIDTVEHSKDNIGFHLSFIPTPEFEVPGTHITRTYHITDVGNVQKNIHTFYDFYTDEVISAGVAVSIKGGTRKIRVSQRNRTFKKRV